MLIRSTSATTSPRSTSWQSRESAPQSLGVRAHLPCYTGCWRLYISSRFLVFYLYVALQSLHSGRLDSDFGPSRTLDTLACSVLKYKKGQERLRQCRGYCSPSSFQRLSRHTRGPSYQTRCGAVNIFHFDLDLDLLG